MKSKANKNKEKDHLARVKKKHRAQFFTNLKIVCNQIAGYDLFSKFPPVFLEKLYSRRFRQISIKYDDGVFSKEEGKNLLELIGGSIMTTLLDNPHGPISLGHMLIEGQTLLIYAMQLKDEEFAAAREIREALAGGAHDDFQAKFHSKVAEMLQVAGLLASAIDHGFVHGQMTHEETDKKTALHYQFYIEKVNCVKETFVVDGNPRPAYRVGWAFPFHGIDWADVKPGVEGITDTNAMPVFIQAHALHRLAERTELMPHIVQFCLYHAIRKFEYIREKEGKLLIAYHYLEKKIGYFVGSVINNRLLLHTFLFITHNGTPEGKLLSKLTGLKKLDKKYLAIDKLSTFISYNIKDNEFVKQIFVQAGCGHLLEIENKHPFLETPIAEMNADAIAKYIKQVLQ